MGTSFSECLFKEVEMRKHVLLLTTTAAIFVCGAIGADAQAPAAPATDHEMGAMGCLSPGRFQVVRQCNRNCKNTSKVGKRKKAMRTAE